LTQPAEQRTVAVHLDRWLEDIVRPRVKPATFRSYTLLARLYIKPALGSIRLTKLTPGDLQALYGALSKRGLSASTVSRVHAVMRSSLRHALDTGLVHRNVSQAARPPAVRREEMQVLDRDQARALLAAARGGRMEALLTLALATGMRQGELLGLRWEDVNLDTGTVRVVRQLGTDGTFSNPKSRQSVRTVDINPSTVAALRAQKIRQLETRAILGQRYQSQDLVFCTVRPWPEPAGSPLGYRNVDRELKALLSRAGLPPIRFHDLRHTAATLMLLADTPLHVVSRRLGHASIVLTGNTYAHVLPSQGREVADRMEAILG
jgi:integrase